MAIDGIHAKSHVTSLARATASEGAQQVAGIKNQEAQTRPRDLVDLTAAPARSQLFDLIAGKVRESAGHSPRGIVEPQDIPSSRQAESDDKLGNFEIQGMMSDLNQAGSLASSLLKKQDDTTSDILRKLG